MILLAATPIGNLGDASVRLRETLERATVIAAEDTRHTAQLLRLLEIENRPELLALHDHNEHERAAALVERATTEDIVLVSDAGMPTVSDPGFRVVQLAAERGVTVSAIPGPSAVITALAVAGLPTDRFAFEGFLPRKSGERVRALTALAAERRTLVFFEAPTRLAATLADLATVFGSERPAAVCRELTKLHEEVRRGPLAELAEWAAAGVRGEIVVVVGGAPAVEVSPETALRELQQRVAAGERLKDASRAVAEATGLSARELYAAALAARTPAATAGTAAPAAAAPLGTATGSAAGSATGSAAAR
ncbi:16S rRNA (cytidine(1402)-2'-O)-methyltransferase [Leucobacter luti]|uniref:Ribosomal RNA small subunit methyltransferase I n=1 Tax=Leucobacter luti TaxID=340320 RepID=A0A4V6MDM8_9MICO|nr:16S rRNA (cytidine(1402)-2'-O)-methyltransferase [Leucobacter luti]MBL3700546.1 16S rRNA (cytidine(1402)-2'-O)-methyltransferase [Leucobacter luti]RZT68619.1 16S rRNA (cytidine1402-2'-O)-methyltransferase [Leucobacter luti]